MLALAALGQNDPRWLHWAAPLLWRAMPWLLPLICKSGLLNRIRDRAAADDRAAAHMTNLFAIGRDNGNGVIRWKGGGIDVEWDYAKENGMLIERMDDAMRAVAAAYDGSFAPVVTWMLFNRITTVHSLGGCHLSDTPERGVVSPRGEVHSYPGLFVADGSVVPTAIGFHPCMTIAALAEYIAEGIARR